MLFEKIVVRALRTLSFLMFVVMIAVVFAQVILRYFFGMPLAWSDELSRLLLVWVSFIGRHPGPLFRRGPPRRHLPGRQAAQRPPRGGGRGAERAADRGLCPAIFKASLEYTVTNHRFVSAVLHYPNSVKYAVVPLSMALMGHQEPGADRCGL